MKATLSTALILQLAAGMAASSLDFTAAAATAEGAVPDAEGQQFLRAQAVELEAGFKASGQAAVTAAVTAATTPLQTEIGSLKATVSTKETELMALRTTSNALNEKTQKLEAAMGPCEKVLCSSINCMNVALGGKEVEIALKGADLVAEHERVKVDFDKKFPGAKVSVSAAKTKDDISDTKPNVLPDFVRVAMANRPAAKV